MPTTRADMDAALKELVVPHLRAIGFAGSLPHLRRRRGAAVDLLGIQFRSSGGAFVVEIGRVAPEGIAFHGRHIPLAKINVTYLTHRYRLGAPLSGGDHWFDYAERDPAEAAREVIAALDRPEVWAQIDSWPVLSRIPAAED